MSFESPNFFVFGKKESFADSNLNIIDPARPYKLDFFYCFFNFYLRVEKLSSINVFSWWTLSILFKS